MGRGRVAFATICFLAVTAFSQSADRPAFEAANLHVSPHKLNPFMTGGFIRAGRYEVRNATLLDLISNAYAVEAVPSAGS